MAPMPPIPAMPGNPPIAANGFGYYYVVPAVPEVDVVPLVACPPATDADDDPAPPGI